MVKVARDQNRPIASYRVINFTECLGINTPEQLRLVEEAIDMFPQNVVVSGEPSPVTKS